MATVLYRMAQTEPEHSPSVDFGVWLDGRRRAILSALQFHDGETHTLKIREYTGVPRGSFSHHIDLLLDPPENLRSGLGWLDGGLIEETGEVEIGLPSPARQFALTDAGERALEEVNANPGVRASDVRDLQQQVEELKADRAADRERIEELESETERMKNAYNDMVDVIRDLDEAEVPE